MRKAVLSNRIFLSADWELEKTIKETLTYTIPPQRHGDFPVVLRTMGKFRRGIITIPSGRMDLIPEGYEIVDKRAYVPVEFPEFRFKLRPSQQEIYDTVEDSFKLNAKVSYGKTFTALAIASKLGQKTLVCVHNLALRDQWEEEVIKCFGFQPGIIGSGRLELDSPIVIGNVQSLTKHILELRNTFGTLIVDECHKCAAPTFTDVVDKSCARYKIGLSGTLKRKDGRHVIFDDYFGPNTIVPPQENSMTPEVQIVASGIKFPTPGTWATKVTILGADPNYQDLVVALALSKANEGHKVLVVGERVDFLQACAEKVGDKAVCITGTFLTEGYNTRKEVLESLDKDKQILFGSRSIFAEGISQNSLSCIILTAPINNEPLLEQLVGRIVRLKEGKKVPVIVDIHFEGSLTSRQERSRVTYYKNQGYNITYLN